jgi:thioredoxin 1
MTVKSGIQLGLFAFILIIGCIAPDKRSNADKDKIAAGVAEEQSGPQTILADTNKFTGSTYKVTFIELGSVKCIPCQHMQIVMKSILEKYGKEVNVVFYDVWTPEGRPYGEKYDITAIPTQVFLDENGNEFFRHEGYFPEEELVKVLNMKGVK